MVRGSGARAYDQGIAHTELHHPQSHPRCCLASYAGWEEATPTRDTTTLTYSVYSGAESEKHEHRIFVLLSCIHTRRHLCHLPGEY